MPPDVSTLRWQRWTVALWTILLVVVCARGALQLRSHSLYFTYTAAGAHWYAGNSLYYWTDTEPGLEPYRYSPIVGVLLVPLQLLPASLGNVLWRLLNAAVLLAGLNAWLRGPLTFELRPWQRSFVYLICLPLALSSLNNAQTNPLMVGLLLYGCAAIGREQWNRAALFLGGAIALKVYPIALALLFATAYPRRFILPLIVVLTCLAGAPFLFGNLDYVFGQYSEWLRVMADDQRKFWPLHMVYRDLWLLVRLTGLPISLQVYFATQVLAGGLCAVICVAGRWSGWPATTTNLAIMTLGTCWMTLCGPATESCTYILLAPALAWALILVRQERWSIRWSVIPWLSASLLLLGVLAGLFPFVKEIHALGPQPLAALLLFCTYIGYYGRLLMHHVTARSVEVPAARAA